MGSVTTGQAAKEFQVTRETVRRWADIGLIDVITTPGGHRRIATSEVHRMKVRMGLEGERKLQTGEWGLTNFTQAYCR